MNATRVGLLVATAIFVLFLLSKLRPRLPRRGGRTAAGGRQPRTPRRARAALAREEMRIWRRIERLDPAVQERLYRRLGERLGHRGSAGPEARGEPTPDV